MVARREITYIVEKNGCHRCTSHFSYRNNDRNNYINIGRKNWSTNIHRYIYAKYHRLCLNKKQYRKLDVLHSCDNKWCINIQHLRLGTHQQNMKEAHDRKLIPIPHGEKNARHKIETESALTIFMEEFSDDKKIPRIYWSRLLGISESHVGTIRCAYSWNFEEIL